MVSNALIGQDDGMDSRIESPPVSKPQNLIGTWRRFGVTGPVYEILFDF